MIAGEGRGLAPGAAVSLFLHVVALLALEARSTDRPFVASTRESVLDVEWWTGDEGRGATRPVPAPSADAPSSAPAPTKREARADDVPLARETPRPESVGERSADARDRPMRPSDAALAVPARRHEAAKIESAGPDGAPRRHDGSVSRRRGARAATEVARSHRSSRFDGKVAADGIAEREPSAVSSGGGRPGAPGPRGNAGSPAELAAYLARVRARIASSQSAHGGEQGRVGIRFLVSADGTFTGLVAVSGDRGPLADAALRVVRRASPASPIPSSLGRTEIPVAVTVTFE